MLISEKEARGSRLLSLVLPKQDVEGSNPFTRFFAEKTSVLALMYH